MTKDEYLIQKQNNQVDLMSAYQFYVNADSTKDKISFREFQGFFPIYLAHGATLNKYWDFFDKQFDIKKPEQ